jgi:Carboxypeptidase regulatory-like domain/CARDB
MRRHQLLTLALLTLVACLDGNRSTGPNFAISDGAHDADGDGSFEHPHFFFLPPMVPAPTPDAAFNASLQPAVQICELNVATQLCVSDVIEFTMTTGPGSETIHRNTVDQLYIVNWNTDATGVVAGATYRIFVRAAPTPLGGPAQPVLGFADVQIASSGKAAKSLASDSLIALVDGRTLPIKFYPGIGALGQCTAGGPTCAEAVVPTTGGLVVAVNADGEAEAFADFPSDWTDEPTTVTIERIDDRGFKTPFEGPLGAPRGVRQWPLFYDFTTDRQGLRFARPVRIGVCNIDEPFTDTFHPEDRSHVSLAIGASPNTFRTLPFAPAEDILGTCPGVERLSTATLPGNTWQALLARAAALATRVLLPQPLYARTRAVLDGGMGGSTNDFGSPVGTVDLAPAPDLFIPTGTPTATPTTVVPGDTVQLSAWSIKNRGNIDLNSPTGTVRNGFYLSTDSIITSSDVFLTDNFNTNDVLQVGEQFDWGGPTLTIPAGTAPGSYYVGILVDDTNLATEFDESNNYVSVPITVRAPTGTISGTVLDQAGAPVAGLTVTMLLCTDASTLGPNGTCVRDPSFFGTAVSTGADGAYQRTGLALGIYQVTVNLTGTPYATTDPGNHVVAITSSGRVVGASFVGQVATPP